MPLSLIGAFFIMLILGYTINLLTLLALVLAIGLVVDDAIIVVENVHRHMEGGMKPLPAAIQGARELAGPIVAISVVLIAVYVPIGFMGGLTGALFTEFAYTLAGAVAVSAVIALTLSPMMCSRFLKPTGHGGQKGFAAWVDRRFADLRHGYERLLHASLNTLAVTGVFAALILASIYFLYASSKSELAPQEDQGIIIALTTASPDATLEQTLLSTRQVFDIFMTYPETDHVFQFAGVNGLNIAFAGMVFKPWDERKRTSIELQPQVQMKLGEIAGARSAAFLPSPLPGSSGLPVQFVIGTTESYERLNEAAQALLGKAYASGVFAYLDSDLKIDKPQITVEIDRDKAAQLGLTMRDVGGALGSMLGGGYVNYFSLAGRSYKVIPQVMQRERLNAAQLGNYHITTPNGSSVPLSTIIRLRTDVVPESLNHFQQLNSATISGVLMPGVTLGAGPGNAQRPGKGGAAPGLQRRLCGPVTAVRAGIDGPGSDVPLRADHHLSRPGGPVREFPRSLHRARERAHVDLRGHDLYQPGRGRGKPEHLHRGGPRDADRPHQQTRDPDRPVRQRSATRGQGQARGGGNRGGHPAAADPDDHGGHGPGRAAARDRFRRRRSRPLQHGARDHDGHLDRHPVHALRGAGDVSVPRRGAREGGICRRERGGSAAIRLILPGHAGTKKAFLAEHAEDAELNQNLLV